MPQARGEEAILEKLRRLSPERKQALFDFLDFLESKESLGKWIEFDEWALNLAREKGFGQLTESDIADIVDDIRSGR